MTHRPDFVMLATEDADLGLVPASTARAEAQQQADELQVPVWLRDPLTDEPVDRVEPGPDPESAEDLAIYYSMMRRD